MRGEVVTVPGPVSPPFRRRRLGRKLRAMREQAHLTLDEAAERLEKTGLRG
ncbi:hypothetical protein [Amycolatopsis sp.]|uniref:hypothetical protein n=1 Tax=Amycolatopsis sp. TaxID=37632 RepID=UPI00262A61F2|nr:hypothetical protein [Amycolatopsis sp.]